MAKRMQASSIAGLQAALRALPKEASVELRDASQKEASRIAGLARSRAMGKSKTYARFVAPTIRARRDRVPVIAVGSRAKLPLAERKTARREAGATYPRYAVGSLLWGVEFGGGKRPTTQQFLPHLGTTGYALWPVIRENLGDTISTWADALYDATVKSAGKAR